ncbi:MAG: alpha/beta hydrolase [Thermomicrobiales bacterium]
MASTRANAEVPPASGRHPVPSGEEPIVYTTLQAAEPARQWTPGFFSGPEGIPLAYWRSGAGWPLLLLHGTSADHRRWQPVLDALATHFTVYNVDRRGRGGSGDAPDYRLEHEYDDVVAMVESFAVPIDIIGHSYGGLITLEAAPRLEGRIRSMVLYESPMNVTDVPLASPEVIARMEAILAAGDREEVVSTLMRDLVQVPEADLAHMRTLPVWQARLGAAPTIPRELRAVLEYRFHPERFRDLTTPTLLLLGGASPANVAAATHAVAAALPNAQTVVLPGQGHVAMDSAPDLFMTEVLQFLRSDTELA